MFFSDSGNVFTGYIVRTVFALAFIHKNLLISNDKHIDLNTKLGGDYCEISIVGRDTEVNEYVYASSYSYVRNVTGRWVREYYYQGLIDSTGKKIYGSVMPEEWTKKIIDFKGNYGIIKESYGGREHIFIVERGNSTPIYEFAEGFDWARNADIINSTDDYILLSNHDIFDVKKRKLIDVKNLFNESESDVRCYRSILDERLNINGEQYIIADFDYDDNGEDGNEHPDGCLIYNLATGNKTKVCRRSFVTVIKEKDSVNSQNRALFLAGYDILNEKLEPVEHGDGELIYISDNMTIVTDKGIYDYDGRLIREFTMELDDNHSDEYWSANWVERNEKGEGLLPVCSMAGAEEVFDAMRTFCDTKGNMISDYKYKTISQFRNGVACVVEQVGSDEYVSYDYRLALIDGTGKKLVNFNEDDISDNVCRKISLSHVCKELEPNGLEFVIYNHMNTAYIYDLSEVADQSGEQQELSYEEKETQDYNKMLEKAEKWDNFKFDGVKTNFKFPDDVPIVGGGEFDFDCTTIPIVAEKSGNVFRVGVGLGPKSESTSLFSLTKNAWNEFKETFEEKGRDIVEDAELFGFVKKYGEVSTGLKEKAKCSIYGYLEGTVSDGRIRSVNGRVVISCSYSVKQQWETVVAYVPIVITVKGEAALEVDGECGVNSKDNSVYIDSKTEIELPKIRLLGGVGFRNLNLSAYGELDNVLAIEGNHVQDYIKGDLGVSFTAAFYEREESLWPLKRKVIYDSGDGIVSSKNTFSLKGTEDDYSINRPEGKTSDWKKDVQDAGTANKMTVLQENIYNQSDPRIVTLNDGSMIMVSTANIEERKIGNHTAVVYSLYDKESKKWSKPRIVEDNGTADFYPSLATDGETTYLAWIDTNSDQFDADVSMGAVAKACEVKVAKFDNANKVFAESRQLTDDDCLDTCPSVMVKNGRPYVAWISNSENDLLDLSGKNSIYCSSYDGDWNTGKVLTESRPLALSRIGTLNDKVSIAYVIDKGEDAGKENNSKVNVVDATSLKDMGSYECDDVTDVEFLKIEDNDVLVLTDREGLKCSKDAKEYSLLIDSEESECSKYDVISDDKNTWIMGCKSAEDKSDIVGYRYKAGKMCPQIPITNQDGYISYVNGTINDGSVNLVFKRDRAKFDDEKFDVDSDICTMDFSEYTDLGLSKMYIEKKSVVPGEEAKVNLVCENVGTKDAGSYTAEVRCEDKVLGSVKISEALKQGEKKEINVPFDVPEDFVANSKLEACVVCHDDVNQKNDKQETTVGFTDMQLNIHEFDSASGKTAELYAENVSMYDAENVSIVCRSQSSTGAVIKKVDVGAVGKGERKKVELGVEEMSEIIKKVQGDSLYVEVITDAEEEYYSNNYGFIFLGAKDEQDAPIATAPPSKQPAGATSPPKSTAKPSSKKPSSNSAKKSLKKPKKVKLKKVQVLKKGKVRVCWKWFYSQNGFQIQYARNRSFTKKRKTFKRSWTSSDATIKKLKKRKKYYFRVRAYRKNGKRKAYGKWSNVKKCVVK